MADNLHENNAWFQSLLAQAGYDPAIPLDPAHDGRYHCGGCDKYVLFKRVRRNGSATLVRCPHGHEKWVPRANPRADRQPKATDPNQRTLRLEKYRG